MRGTLRGKEKPTGASTETVTLPEPSFAPLEATTSTGSGLLMSVTYATLLSELLSCSTRVPPLSVVTAPLATGTGESGENSLGDLNGFCGITGGM